MQVVQLKATQLTLAAEKLDEPDMYLMQHPIFLCFLSMPFKISDLLAPFNKLDATVTLDLTHFTWLPPLTQMIRYNIGSPNVAT